jgi:hypothetical protein
MRATTNFAIVLGLAALSGCQAIAGTETRTLDPVLEGCTLPTGSSKIRFANLVPDDTVVDLCVRPAGGAYTRPVLRGAGTGCAKSLGRADAGYAYAEVSVPFGAPANKIDVRVIKAGDTCSGTALTEGSNLDVPANGIATIVRMGNEKGQQIAAFPEDTENAPSGSSKVRLVHAAPGVPSLDWAVTAATALPAEIGSLLVKEPIAYGTATNGKSTPSSTFKIDDNGYLQLPGTPFNIGAAPHGDTKAILLAPLPVKEFGRTIYAIGDPTKPFFQVRALTCGDGEVNGLKTGCTLSQLGTISVDVYNAYLYGAFAPDQDLRRPGVIKTIAGRDSDIQCLDSLNKKEDRDAVIAAAKANGFLYSYVSDTNETTPPTDPRDQNGKTPTPFSTAPCAGTNDPTEVEATIACIQNNCTSGHTGDSKLAGDSSCISSSCAVEFIPFLAGDLDHHRCFSCMAAGATTDISMDELRTKCTMNAHDYRPFDGQTDSMIVSRFPLTNTETFVLPSTLYQRVVHYAQVEIEKSKFVDFYCAEFTAAYGELLPYYGFYAPGKDLDPWYQEQLLQAQRLVEYVKKKSGMKPAIIAGEFAASRLYNDPMTGMTVIDDQNGAVFALLEAPGNFFPAIPNKYKVQCTECAAPANPYNSDQNLWQFRTYVYNLPATSGVEINLYGQDLNAITNPAGQPRPLTDRWGYNTRVLRP